jgi:hypothetical protein
MVRVVRRRPAYVVVNIASVVVCLYCVFDDVVPHRISDVSDAAVCYDDICRRGYVSCGAMWRGWVVFLDTVAHFCPLSEE